MSGLEKVPGEVAVGFSGLTEFGMLLFMKVGASLGGVACGCVPFPFWPGPWDCPADWPGAIEGLREGPDGLIWGYAGLWGMRAGLAGAVGPTSPG